MLSTLGLRAPKNKPHKNTPYEKHPFVLRNQIKSLVKLVEELERLPRRVSTPLLSLIGTRRHRNRKNATVVAFSSALAIPDGDATRTIRFPHRKRTKSVAPTTSLEVEPSAPPSLWPPTVSKAIASDVEPAHEIMPSFPPSDKISLPMAPKPTVKPLTQRLRTSSQRETEKLRRRALDKKITTLSAEIYPLIQGISDPNGEVTAQDRTADDDDGMERSLLAHCSSFQVATMPQPGDNVDPPQPFESISSWDSTHPNQASAPDYSTPSAPITSATMLPASNLSALPKVSADSVTKASDELSQLTNEELYGDLPDAPLDSVHTQRDSHTIDSHLSPVAGTHSGPQHFRIPQETSGENSQVSEPPTEAETIESNTKFNAGPSLTESTHPTQVSKDSRTIKPIPKRSRRSVIPNTAASITADTKNKGDYDPLDGPGPDPPDAKEISDRRKEEQRLQRNSRSSGSDLQPFQSNQNDGVTGVEIATPATFSSQYSSLSGALGCYSPYYPPKSESTSVVQQPSTNLTMSRLPGHANVDTPSSVLSAQVEEREISGSDTSMLLSGEPAYETPFDDVSNETLAPISQIPLSRNASWSDVALIYHQLFQNGYIPSSNAAVDLPLAASSSLDGALGHSNTLPGHPSDYNMESSHDYTTSNPEVSHETNMEDIVENSTAWFVPETAMDCEHGSAAIEKPEIPESGMEEDMEGVFPISSPSQPVAGPVEPSDPAIEMNDTCEGTVGTTALVKSAFEKPSPTVQYDQYPVSMIQYVTDDIELSGDQGHPELKAVSDCRSQGPYEVEEQHEEATPAQSLATTLPSSASSISNKGGPATLPELYSNIADLQSDALMLDEALLELSREGQSQTAHIGFLADTADATYSEDDSKPNPADKIGVNVDQTKNCAYDDHSDWLIDLDVEILPSSGDISVAYFPNGDSIPDFYDDLLSLDTTYIPLSPSTSSWVEEYQLVSLCSSPVQGSTPLPNPPEILSQTPKEDTAPPISSAIPSLFSQVVFHSSPYSLRWRPRPASAAYLHRCSSDADARPERKRRTKRRRSQQHTRTGGETTTPTQPPLAEDVQKEAIPDGGTVTDATECEATKYEIPNTESADSDDSSDSNMALIVYQPSILDEPCGCESYSLSEFGLFCSFLWLLLNFFEALFNRLF